MAIPPFPYGDLLAFGLAVLVVAGVTLGMY